LLSKNHVPSMEVENRMVFQPTHDECCHGLCPRFTDGVTRVPNLIMSRIVNNLKSPPRRRFRRRGWSWMRSAVNVLLARQLRTCLNSRFEQTAIGQPAIDNRCPFQGWWKSRALRACSGQTSVGENTCHAGEGRIHDHLRCQAEQNLGLAGGGLTQEESTSSRRIANPSV